MQPNFVVFVFENLFYMKKILLSLLVGAMLLSAWSLHADNVDEEQSLAMAKYYGNIQPGSKTAVELVRTVQNHETGEAVMRLYNYQKGGYIIISGTDLYAPVVAYSEDGSIEDMPPAMQFMLDEWAKGIEQLQKYGSLAPTCYQAMWRPSQHSAKAGGKQYNTVITKWSQGDPQGTGGPFNLLCPKDKYGYAVCGCVALGMAQVLNYWKYPVCPRDSTFYYEYSIEKKFVFEGHQYNYSIIPNNGQVLSGNVITLTEPKFYEIAKLCFHTGVSVHSSYSASGTSSNLGDQVNNALQQFFKYERYDKSSGKNTGYRYLNRGSYSNTVWCEMMKKEILEKRPIIYQAQDAGQHGGRDAGHCFLITGYVEGGDKDGMFKVNWGWGGGSDGWFNMQTPDGLVPLKSKTKDTMYVYSVGQAGFFGLMPPLDSIPEALRADTVYTMLSIGDVKSLGAQLQAVYPNPSNTVIHIPYNLQAGQSDYIMVYNVQGMLVDKVSASYGENTATLNISNYPRGVYFCRLRGASQRFIVK